MSKKGKSKRSTSGNGGRNQFGSTKVGMPSVYRRTLVATSTYNTAVAGVQVSQTVGCNTPFQPFRTVTTSIVPQYLATLSSIYDRTYVERARIEVELVNATLADAVFTVLSHDGNSTVSTDINELSDYRYSQSKTLGYYSGGNVKAIYRSEFTPERHLGIPAIAAENVCLGTDPSDPYFWCITVKPSAGATGNVAYKIRVVYDLVFSELKGPTP